MEDPMAIKDGTITHRHPDGKLFFTETWADGKEHGYFEYNWSDGKPFYKGWYICGKRHGWWEDYWSDGRPRYIGYYDMDIEVGYKTDVRDKIIDLVLEYPTESGLGFAQ